MKKTKTKQAVEQKPVEAKTLEATELARMGRGIKLELDAHFQMWETGLEFKRIFAKFARVAKSLGMSVSEFSYILESQGFVIIRTTPAGNRYVFSGECTWTEAQFLDHLRQIDLDKDLTKQLKKEARRAHA